MPTNKEKEAYWKGYSDSNYHAEHMGDLAHLLKDLFHSCYNPPYGYEEAYRQGWKDAERDRRGRR